MTNPKLHLPNLPLENFRDNPHIHVFTAPFPAADETPALALCQRNQPHLWAQPGFQDLHLCRESPTSLWRIANSKTMKVIYLLYYRFCLEPDRICEAEVRMKSGKLHLAKENGSPKKWFRLIHIFVGGSYDMYTCFTCPNRTGIHPGPRIIGFGLPANKHKSQYQFQMLLQFA